MSRDVRDVVSHSLAMIAVRSGVARLVLDSQPGEARAALTAIETASRSALDEVRLVLRQIREPGGGSAGPRPGSGDLPELVRRFRENGLEVSYRRTGEHGSYGDPVELSAYRIAQEALTNVVRHAPGASAVLEVGYEPDRLTISVTDDGPGGEPQPAPGLGLAGMRERALLHDGQFRAGPLPDGGFQVEALLPAGNGGARHAGGGT